MKLSILSRGWFGVARLGLEYIESCLGDLPVFQRRDQGVLVHRATPAAANEHGAWLHRRELRFADHVVGLRVQGDLQRHIVGNRQHVVQIVEPLDAVLPKRPVLGRSVVCDNPQAERLQSPSERSADGPPGRSGLRPRRRAVPRACRQVYPKPRSAWPGRIAQDCG